MNRHGWTLLFHECLIAQMRSLFQAAAKAETHDPDGFEGNANVKLFRALSRLILETIPIDPGREEYRQGKTLGETRRHWRRAKIGRRFRLFFRYDSRSKIIVYAWVNDEDTLRSAGGKNDPYTVFQKMLERGNPPGDWAALVAVSKGNWV